MNHLHWLISGPYSEDVAALRKHSMASIRLRCAPSIRAAQECGWKVSFGEVIPASASMVIVGKIGANQIDIRGPAWIKQLIDAKPTTIILIDYSDNHLGVDTVMSSFYRETTKLADACICPSKCLADLLLKEWQGSVDVIPDPIEIEISPPKTSIQKPVTLLWFGHSSNIDFLIEFLGDGFKDEDHIRLLILSNEAGLSHFSRAKILSNAKVEIQLALWSIESMREAEKYVDMCIIPSNLSNPKKLGASSNRLLTALAMGLPVAADNLPSYLEFSEFYCNLRDKSFREMLGNPQEFCSQVISAQNTVIPSFSLKKIESDWQKYLQEVGAKAKSI